MRIRDELLEDHAEIDGLLRELENCAEGADPPTLQRAWGVFEDSLAAHLDAEERYLFPALEKKCPDAVRRARADHDAIRRQMTELGVSTELHLVRKAQVDALLELLKNHASMEDQCIYPLADKETHPEHAAGLRRLLARLRSRARAVHDQGLQGGRL